MQVFHVTRMSHAGLAPQLGHPSLRLSVSLRPHIRLGAKVLFSPVLVSRGAFPRPHSRSVATRLRLLEGARFEVARRLSQLRQSHRASCSVRPAEVEAQVMGDEAGKGEAMTLEKWAAQFPKPEGVTFSYGTAGFRAQAELLPSTVFRMGVLAALRALLTGRATGLMVTASHNAVGDNGVKLADPEGGMLAMAWEGHATRLANAPDAAALGQVVEEIRKLEGVPSRGEGEGKARVLLARDTRPSGDHLAQAARLGIAAVPGVEPLDLGILTTPQLHWLVRAANDGHPPSEALYLQTLHSGFRALMDLLPVPPEGRAAEELASPLLVDGANGVGALKLRQLAPLVAPLGLRLEVRNEPGGSGVLNEGVGADFVQKDQKAPEGFDAVRDAGRRCVSLDGDADRLVFFYFRPPPPDSPASPPQFRLLDGDKIAALAASFVAQQLEALGGGPAGPPPLPGAPSTTTDKTGRRGCHVDGYGEVSLGVVQTAYANGASTRCLEQGLGLEVVRTPTGVKHLHERAVGYDVGIYFEANGHGTVLLGERFLRWLREEGRRGESAGGGSERLRAARRLVALHEAVNPAVGDALSGILLVEAVLRYRHWSVQDWDALYQDLPSRQLKVRVADRTSIATTDAETRVERPEGLQAAIDEEVAKHENGRAFVRPSGTEDVVRVYAEAASQDAADSLARAVAAHVHRLAGGVGLAP